jgi:hypothetical protein
MRYLSIDHPWVSSRHAPLYEVVFPARASHDEVAELCRELERWHARSHHLYAWVFDLSKVDEATPMQRATFRAHMERVRDHDALWHQGAGLVLPNAFLRGIVTAAFWFVPPKYAHATFATHDEAFAWASARLEVAQRERAALPR